MSKFLVAIFDNESSAYEGKKALLQLERNEDIVIFSSAIITKDKNGNISVKHAADEGPIGTATGLLIGSLTGLTVIAAGAAAPAIAVAGGASIGGLSGLFADLHKSGTDIDFANEIATHLKPSGVALIADILETWTTPVNEELKKHGAILFRQNRSQIIEDNFLRKIENIESEIEELQEEFKNSNLEFTESIKERINNKKNEIKEKAKVVKDYQNNLKEQMKAKIEKLKKIANDSKTKNKKKFDEKIKKTEESLHARSRKLEQAYHLAKEAIT